ncbi:uncharacterized protein EMH_0043070 [Eimeria mitis]|uniref:Uncharacterized protein n=1 Tax=Eimeria mitis TaxID=44415 RepID=U6JTA3_9EIME|nr:uncharacterized protein EMH_0043070 [Eimeria mitis]CDJ28690.1 hypothetical protein EMH_0043070 [Eimeria mitis]
MVVGLKEALLREPGSSKFKAEMWNLWRDDADQWRESVQRSLTTLFPETHVTAWSPVDNVLHLLNDNTPTVKERAGVCPRRLYHGLPKIGGSRCVSISSVGS